MDCLVDHELENEFPSARLNLFIVYILCTEILLEVARRLKTERHMVFEDSIIAAKANATNALQWLDMTQPHEMRATV